MTLPDVAPGACCGPADSGEVSAYKIVSPRELPALLDQLEFLLPYQAPALF